MYEYPWDPAADPQKFHIFEDGHRTDCEDGKLTDECYKTRWHPLEPKVKVAPVKEYKKPTSQEIVVPKGVGGGSADTESPPDEKGENTQPRPPGKLPPKEREAHTAPRSPDTIGDNPLESVDSQGVEQERGDGEFEQPVGTPEASKGAPPEPKKDIPSEARHSTGPEARSQSGYAFCPLLLSAAKLFSAVLFNLVFRSCLYHRREISSGESAVLYTKIFCPFALFFLQARGQADKPTQSQTNFCTKGPKKRFVVLRESFPNCIGA